MSMHARPAAALLASLCATLGFLTTPAAADRDFADLSLEELMSEPVTSVSKRETRLGDAAAAVTVITGEEIRRLGITTLAESLRLVPGMNVARIDGNHWAVSPRGFNMQYAGKLLVLIDGRSAYTPMFGGVYWNGQDMPLDDIERIEVIRGPGATLWGANAVNGVINIISKTARHTQGATLSAAVGTEDRPTLQARYGDRFAAVDEGEAHYRVYAKYFDREGLLDPQGQAAADGWRSLRTGFRADWDRSAETALTLQGEHYSLDSSREISEATFTPPFSRDSESLNANRGTNVLGRWSQVLAEEEQLMLQVYWDSFTNDGETRDTADLQLEHRLPLGSRNDVIWGLGYRWTTDEIKPTQFFSMTPASRELHLATAFVQDEITLVPERLNLVVGSKVEHNDFTGLEVQPTLRLKWHPSERGTLWAAVSRAVSTPSRFHHDANLLVTTIQPPGSPIVAAAIAATPGLAAETLQAYELGWRVHSATASLDIATFHHRYERLYRAEPGAPRFVTSPAPPHLLVPLYWRDNGTGDSYGVEATFNWQPLAYWRLVANYSWLHLDLQRDVYGALGSPAHQGALRSYLSLPMGLELNCAAYYVGAVEPVELDGTTVQIDSYVRLDAGLIHRLREDLEIGVWGHNLLDNRHAEFRGQAHAFITDIPRSVTAKITKRF